MPDALTTMLDGAAGRLLLVVLLLSIASVVQLALHRRDGVFRPGPAGDDVAVLTAGDLGLPLGSRATFVQFSTPTCATCPQVSRTLREVAGRAPGVDHIEVPAERRLDLVRRFGVLRTPTVLLLGPDGDIRSRTSGPMGRRQAEAALAEHVGSAAHARA